MDLQSGEENEGQTATVKKSFTQALKEKYCMSDGLGYDSINVIISPKRKNATAELGHLRTVGLNNMNVMTADIPQQGLMSLCPNVVDLDLANNLLDKWSELLAILCHMPQLKFVNASKNSLSVDTEYDDLPKSPLNIENLALNYTGITIEDITHISQIMPALKELHLCGNGYEHLGSVDEKIRDGAFASLECLRLNNNRIKSWAEVWKLRNLKCLKSLILSDNPVSHLFYRKEKNGNDPSNDKDTKPQQNEQCPLFDKPDLQSFQNDPTTNQSKIAYRSHKVIDDVKCDLNKIYEKESIDCQQMNNDSEPLGMDIPRPVSRIGRHEDSDVDDQEDGLSDEENRILHGTSEDEHDEDVLNPYHWFDPGHESNDSFNTNSSILTVTDDDSFMDTTTGTDSSETDMPKDSQISHDDCDFTLIAESFLYDIINKIDFLSSQTSITNECPTNIMSDKESSIHVPSGSSTLDLNMTGDNVSDCRDSCITNVRNQMDVSPISNQNDEVMFQCCEYLNQTVSSNFEKSLSKDVMNIASANLCKNCLLTTLEDGSLVCYSCYSSVADVKHCKQKSDSETGGHSFPSTCDHQDFILNEEKQNVYDSSLSTRFNEQLLVSDIERSPRKSDSDSRHYDDLTSKLENITDAENCENVFEIIPFENLEMLCLSNTSLSHWKDLAAFSLFPRLTSLRVQCNPLYSSVKVEDRRKLYIASLPNVNILNGSEVSATEREKAERHYLRHFMHEGEKPDIYHSLVKKHGEPVELVDIDLSAGYQEWALLDFICDGQRKFSKKVHLTEQVGKLRILISQTLIIPKNCFIMHYNPCSNIHPEYERDMTELRCESLPMSRFNFADGDEIHIEIRDP